MKYLLSPEQTLVKTHGPPRCLKMRSFVVLSLIPLFLGRLPWWNREQNRMPEYSSQLLQFTQLKIVLVKDMDSLYFVIAQRGSTFCFTYFFVSGYTFIQFKIQKVQRVLQLKVCLPPSQASLSFRRQLVLISFFLYSSEEYSLYVDEYKYMCFFFLFICKW